MNNNENNINELKTRYGSVIAASILLIILIIIIILVTLLTPRNGSNNKEKEIAYDEVTEIINNYDKYDKESLKYYDYKLTFNESIYIEGKYDAKNTILYNEKKRIDDSESFSNLEGKIDETTYYFKDGINDYSSLTKEEAKTIIHDFNIQFIDDFIRYDSSLYLEIDKNNKYYLNENKELRVKKDDEEILINEYGNVINGKIKYLNKLCEFIVNYEII